MNTHAHVGHPQGDPRPPGRIGSVKAEPTACLERRPADTSPSLGSWQNRDRTCGAEDIRCRGRNPGTRSHEIPPYRSKAIKSLCSSVRRFRDATIKKSAKAIILTLFRLCGKRWIVGSGGRPDPELSPDVRTIQKDDFRRRTCAPVPHPGTAQRDLRSGSIRLSKASSSDAVSITKPNPNQGKFQVLWSSVSAPHAWPALNS
jgi:hypothetical protein